MRVLTAPMRSRPTTSEKHKKTCSLNSARVRTLRLILLRECFADRRVAAGASREAPGEGDDEPSPESGDRVWDVSFGSDRRRLLVGNPGEGQIPTKARRKSVLRGEGRRVRRSRNRKRRYRVSRDGESRATRAFVIAKAKLLLELLIIALATAILRCRPADQMRHPRARWQTNTWSARLRLAATRSAATLRRAVRSAWYRDGGR